MQAVDSSARTYNPVTAATPTAAEPTVSCVNIAAKTVSLSSSVTCSPVTTSAVVSHSSGSGLVSGSIFTTGLGNTSDVGINKNCPVVFSTNGGIALANVSNTMGGDKGVTNSIFSSSFSNFNGIFPPNLGDPNALLNTARSTTVDEKNIPNDRVPSSNGMNDFVPRNFLIMTPVTSMFSGVPGNSFMTPNQPPVASNVSDSVQRESRTADSGPAGNNVFCAVVPGTQATQPLTQVVSTSCNIDTARVVNTSDKSVSTNDITTRSTRLTRRLSASLSSKSLQ